MNEDREAITKANQPESDGPEVSDVVLDLEGLLGLRSEPHISVVIPLRDEDPTLEPLYASLTKVLERHGRTFELIFVDDGSRDDSLRHLSAIAGQDPRVRVLQLRRNFGKAGALATGFRESRGGVVITIDADLQDDPTEIPRLIEKLEEGYDVVSGWKRRRRDPLGRRLASRVFNWTSGRLTGVRLHDVNCGLKAYSGDCAREIADALYGELHRFLPVLAYWRGYRVTELPVNHRPRSNGKSRYGLERYVRAFLDLLTVTYISRYRRRAMHLFGGVGLLLFVPGSVSLAYLVFSKLVFGTSLGDRPLLILGAVLCIAGLQLILAGLLAEMVSGSHPDHVPYRRVKVVRASPPLHEAGVREPQVEEREPAGAPE